MLLSSADSPIEFNGLYRETSDAVSTDTAGHTRATAHRCLFADVRLDQCLRPLQEGRYVQIWQDGKLKVVRQT